MDTQDPNLIIAAGASHYESPQIAASRALQIQQQQQALTAGAQNLQIGAQDLQAKTYGNQETATQLAEQQAIMKAVQAEGARAAGGLPVPATSATPAAGPAGAAAPLPLVPDGSGLIDRTGTPATPATPPAAAPPPAAAVAPTPFNWDNVLSATRGQIRPNTSLAMQGQVQASKQKMADFQKTQGEIQAAQEKLNDDKNDEASQQALLVQKGGYTLPAVAVMAQHLELAGHPDAANQLRQLVAQNPDKIKPVIDAIAAGSTATMQTAQARAVAAATGQQKQDADLPIQQANAAQATRVNTAQQLLAAPTADAYYAQYSGIDKSQRALLPDFDDPQRTAKLRQYALTPEQQTTADATKARDANTVTNDAAMRQQGNARLGLEASGLAIRKVEADPFGQLGLNPHPPAAAQTDANGQSLTGPAYLNTLPAGLQARVKAIAEGRDTSIPRGAQQGPLMAAVNQYDPTYNATRGKARAAFTSGKQGQNVQALNTATVHLDQLATDASDALKNGSFRPGNAAYNSLSAAFGQNAVTNFDALKTAVAGEMATALKGNATDQEIQAHHQHLAVRQLAGAARGGVARTQLARPGREAQYLRRTVSPECRERRSLVACPAGGACRVQQERYSPALE